MKSYLAKILVLALVLTLGIMFAVARSQKPSAAQGEIGPAGLADGPSGSDVVYYMFTGVYNIETGPNPKFATVVHCTNIGPTSATVKVQFFDRVSGIPASGSVAIPPSNTRSISTQPIASFNTLALVVDTNIAHGSGWVLAPADKELICVVEVVSLDNGGTPIGSVDLPLFDENGDCVSSDCINLGDDDGGLFLPIIFRNSLSF